MKVDLSKAATKEYARLPKSEQSKVSKKLLLLKQEPNSGKKLSGELNSFRCLRAWPYRIIYHTESSQVVVDHILHRQDVYK